MMTKSINLTQFTIKLESIKNKENTKDFLIPISITYAFYRSIMGDNQIGAEIRVLPYPVSISLPNLLREVGLQRIQWSYKVTFASYHHPENQGAFTSNPSLSTMLTLRILLQSRSYQDQSTQKSCKLEGQYEQIAYLNQKSITKESQKQVPCEGTRS
jgi:hypothetical protein